MNQGVLYGTVLFKKPNILVNGETSQHTYTLRILDMISVLHKIYCKEVCFDSKDTLKCCSMTTYS